MHFFAATRGDRMKILEIAHLTTRNSENASASGGKPLTPSPPHVTNNGKHKKNLISCRFCVIEKTQK